uniref:G-protein coupled receptors family 1 profile domain-containing protein n=1 Tax=Oryzias latipes TaxID=8090 RepID=H2MEP1_ORYLA
KNHCLSSPLISMQNNSNLTAAVLRNGLVEVTLYYVVTTLPCCLFLFINVTMLFTLRSKAVFRETSRYILLFNLLFSDTVQLAHNQIMLLLSGGKPLVYPLCIALTALSFFSHNASILTLVLMCLERYIAVCYPLRHAAIVTIKNTGEAVCVLWTFSLLIVLVEVVLMLNVPFKDLPNKQLREFCGRENLYPDQVAEMYHKVFTYFLFTYAGVTVTFSYIAIMLAARSASTDKASARKARKTLLLHLMQLGLSMSATVQTSLLILIFQSIERSAATSVQVFLYILLSLLPKCLSSLIYGLRDQTIRPVLMLNLSCGNPGFQGKEVVLQ